MIFSRECGANVESEIIWTTIETILNYFEYQAWFFALVGSAMVGLSGIFPLLVIPDDKDAHLNNQGGKFLDDVLSLFIIKFEFHFQSFTSELCGNQKIIIDKLFFDCNSYKSLLLSDLIAQK